MLYSDQFVIDAPQPVVASFIGDAQRILDYYPAGVSAQNIVPEQLLACYGKGTASLLERDNTQSRPDFLVFKVYCCVTFAKNLTPGQFKQKAIFCMTECWSLQTLATKQTAVTKTWQQLTVRRWRVLPKSVIAMLVRLGAERERGRLLVAWNNAAGDV